MKRVILLFLIVFSIPVFATSLYAEDVDLERIVITPSGVAESYGSLSRKVDLITSKDIENTGATNIEELLTGLTSVNISNYGGPGATKTIRMRGSTAAGVLVLLDGRPVNNPRDGETELSSIPLDDIERIEVMHGPGSHIYGSQAMGGVVNIITKNPPIEGQRIKFSSSFGTFRTYDERLSYGARIRDLGVSFNAGYQSSEGFRDNSEFTSKDWNAKFIYNLNDQNGLEFRPSFYVSKLGTPGSIVNPDLDDKQGSLKNSLDFKWSFTPDELTEVSTRFYKNYNRLEFIEDSAGSIWDTALDKSIHTTKVYGVELQGARQLFENCDLIGGLNYVKNLNDSTTSAKHEYIVRAGYLQAEMEVFDNFEAGCGLRMDDYSNFGQKYNPSAQLSYRFGDDLKLHTLFSRSFRAPTFNDLYWPDQGWARGNPDLEPEEGATGEFGVSYRVRKNLNLDLTYYRSKYTKLINWAENNSGVWVPTNVDSAGIDGIEFESGLFFMDNFQLNLGYTFLRAKDRNTHNFLIYQPEHKVDAALKFNDFCGLIVELKGQFTGQRYHDAANDIKVKQFFLWDLYLSKDIRKGVTCYVKFDNMLVRHYQVIRDYPMPGFSATGGFRLDF